MQHVGTVLAADLPSGGAELAPGVWLQSHAHDAGRSKMPSGNLLQGLAQRSSWAAAGELPCQLQQLLGQAPALQWIPGPGVTGQSPLLDTPRTVPGESHIGCQRTMRFGSNSKVLAKRTIKYYRTLMVQRSMHVAQAMLTLPRCRQMRDLG